MNAFIPYSPNVLKKRYHKPLTYLQSASTSHCSLSLKSQSIATMADESFDGAGIVATPESDREVVRLWRAWRTVNEMCKDRVSLITPAPCGRV